MGFDDALVEKHRQMIIGEMEAQTREGKWGVKDPSAVSALALAARGGHIDVVFVLLAGGALPNRGYGPTDRTPLHDVVDCVRAQENGFASLQSKGGSFGERIKALVWTLSMGGAEPDRPPRVAHAEAYSPLDYARAVIPSKIDAAAMVRVLNSGAERTTRADRSATERLAHQKQELEAARQAANTPVAMTQRMSPGRVEKVVSKVEQAASFKAVQQSQDPSGIPRFEIAASVRGDDRRGDGNILASVTRLVHGEEPENWGRGCVQALSASPKCVSCVPVSCSLARSSQT